MDLAYLVYVSRSALDPADPMYRCTIQGLLEVSRRNNAATGVTGALLYSDHWFAQYLEGAPEDVEATFARIAADTTHHSIRRSRLRPIRARRFADWMMAYAGPTRATAAALATHPLASLDVGDRSDRRFLVDRLLALVSREPRQPRAAGLVEQRGIEPLTAAVRLLR